MRWSAAQALAWIIKGVPLELKDWTREMGPEIERAQIKLSRAIGADQVKAWGRPKPHALIEQIPSDQFRISGLTLIVNPHGDLATSPRHKLSAYQGQQWQDIEFDADEIKQAWPKPPAPLISDWMRKNASRRRQRDDLVRDCMTATNCSRRQALAAYGELPEEQRRKRGKPSKTSG
jgi:hypothetical protein